jgi:hypothetical protein
MQRDQAHYNFFGLKLLFIIIYYLSRQFTLFMENLTPQCGVRQACPGPFMTVEVVTLTW